MAHREDAGAGGQGLSPEARLIRAKREGAVPRMSVRQAAADAAAKWGRGGWSEATWRLHESGRSRLVPMPPGRLACMALIAGVLPEELGQAGRDDGAAALRDLMRQEAERPEVPQELREQAEAEAGAGLDALLAEIVLGLQDIDGSRQLTARQKRELREELIAGIVRDVAARRGHVRAILKITSEHQ